MYKLTVAYRLLMGVQYISTVGRNWIGCQPAQASLCFTNC